MNIFDRINAYIESAEGSIITLVTTLVPWLAPALPAYLTFSHLRDDISIPFVISLAMASSVELLGLASIATAFSAMRNNKLQRANKNKVSLAFPVVAYVFYITVVLVVNVVLELPMQEEYRQYARIVAIALLTLISAPAFVIAVSRQEQREIESESGAKSGRKAKKAVAIAEFVCECGQSYASQNALNAHKKIHRNIVSSNGHHKEEKVAITSDATK